MGQTDSRTENIHATGLVLGGTGVMLRGASGTGKSLIALSLLTLWEDRGVEASLVSDDRVEIWVRKGQLMMAPPARIAGLIELRGRGIVSRPFVPEARVDLVVDLVDTLDRMPEEADQQTEILGVGLARCPVPRTGLTGLGHQILLVREALRALPAAGLRQKTT
jgi:HPr kinase/phosphorylase